MKKFLVMKKVLLLLFLASMFFVGRGVGYAVRYVEAFSAKSGEAQNWGLGFGQEGTQPSGNASAEKLAEYDAYYVGSGSEKVIYLTFDCGYENGNTEPILDALKKHNAPATFFVCAGYCKENGGRRAYGRKSYIPSSGYVENIGYGFFPKGNRRCGVAVCRNNRKGACALLQAAAGDLQYGKFEDGKRAGIPYFFLEPCLCRLVSG